MKGIYRMPGSKYLWFRWTEDGKRYAVSLKTDDEAVAIPKARAILAEGMFRPKPHQGGIETVISEYLRVALERPKKPMRPHTAQNVGHLLRRFTRDCGVEFVGQIAHQKIRDWLQGLKAEGRSRDTLHSYATDLKTFVRWLVKTKHLAPEVLDSFDVPDRGAHGRKNWVRSEVAADVIARATEPDLKFILYAGFHAGLRRNEIANARVGWFDLDARPLGLVHIQNDEGFTLKDRDNRTVPLTHEFFDFLTVFLKGKNPREFALRPTKELGLWKYRYDFQKIVRTHFARCGIKCTIHDLRRSFASNLVSEGESVYIVAKWLGDGVQVVERSYGHLAPSAGNINRLTAKAASQPRRSGSPYSRQGTRASE
jgi:integrase